MSSPPKSQPQRRESAFLQLPVYLRKNTTSKFAKVNAIWIGRNWSLTQVRTFLFESKQDTIDEKQFQWLPNEFVFFHPDTEKEISLDIEDLTFVSSFQKSFVAIQSKSNPESRSESGSPDIEAAMAEMEEEIDTALATDVARKHRSSSSSRRKASKSRTESMASDVSVEANTLMFQVNETFRDYPDKLAEFTQILDAFGKEEITRPELKWAVKQLCIDVPGGGKLLSEFNEHLPKEDYELIMNESPIRARKNEILERTSVVIDEENNEIVQLEQSNSTRDTKQRDSKTKSPTSPKSSKHKRKSSKSKKTSKNKSRSRSNSKMDKEEKHSDTSKQSRKSSKRRSRSKGSNNDNSEIRRIMSDPPKDSYLDNQFDDEHRPTSTPPYRDTSVTSSVSGNRRNTDASSPFHDVENARIRGEQLLHHETCHGVVADVVSYSTNLRSTSNNGAATSTTTTFTVQVLAMDENGQAMERWTVERVFHDFLVLNNQLKKLIQSWHRPLEDLADEHHLITRLSPLLSSNLVLEERMQYLSSYLREAVMSVQAAAVFNHQISGGARGTAARDSMLKNGNNVRNAGELWNILANFLSVRNQTSDISRRYGGEMCCECETTCPCCRSCLSGSILVTAMILLPLLSSSVSLLYPAALGFNDARVQGTISEIRITWLICILRDIITFVLLFVLTVCIEGCKTGCNRIITAGWKSPASPLLHVLTVCVLGCLYSGWQTMYLLGIQYVFPPTLNIPDPHSNSGSSNAASSFSSSSSLPDAKHHLFVASALCMVPLMYLFFSAIVGVCMTKKNVLHSIVDRSKDISWCRIGTILLGMVLIAVVGIVNVTTSFDLNLPCYANITTNASKIDNTPSSSGSNHNSFTSTCLRLGFILLCTSSACLALYISLLSTWIYHTPKRHFRPFSTSAWSACFAMFCSIFVGLIGLNNVEGGISSMFEGMPPVNDLFVYGVVPGVVSSVSGYIMLAWMVLNTSGDATSSIYGIPLVFTVIACAVGFKWENLHTLQWNGYFYAALSLLGVGMVVFSRAKDWCKNENEQKEGKGNRISLLGGGANNGNFTPYGSGNM